MIRYSGSDLLPSVQAVDSARVQPGRLLRHGRQESRHAQ